MRRRELHGAAHPGVRVEGLPRHPPVPDRRHRSFCCQRQAAGARLLDPGGIQDPFTCVPINHPRLRFEELRRPTDDVADFESLDRVLRGAQSMVQALGVRHPSRRRILSGTRWSQPPWRAGRSLAGDACHEMPPRTGQGLCSGIRDLPNLSWKLWRIIRGQSFVDLLDTYESERSPHISVVVEVAQAMANQIEAMPEAPPRPNRTPRNRTRRRRSGASRYGPRSGPASSTMVTPGRDA